MDQNKLEELRRRYGAASADADIRDPTLRAVAEAVFAEPGNRSLPYANPPSLLSAPLVADLGELDIALIGVPMDLGVTNRPGARFGPRAIRGMERVGPYNHALKVLPAQNHRIGDVGDVPFRSRYSLDQSIEDIETFYHGVVDAGVRPVIIPSVIRSSKRSASRRRSG